MALKNNIKYVVFGGRWWDSVNGNTHCNAKILEIKTGNIYYSGFSYGYGSAYLYNALTYIKNNINKKIDISNLRDMGYAYYNKKVVKDNLF